MKIAIVKKDGKIFNTEGEEAERIVESYRKREDRVISIGGTFFSVREVKEIIETDKKQERGETKTCGECRDGWVEVSKTGKWTGAPCDFTMQPCACSLGINANIILDEKK